MKKTRLFSLLLALTLIVTMVSGCASSKPATPATSSPAVTSAAAGAATTAPAASKEPIKIGNIRGLTGSSPDQEKGATVAIEMMIEEINASGGLLGRPIKLITYDTKDDVTEGVNSYKRLVEQDKVVAIANTAISNVALAIGPVAESYKVPAIGAHLDPKTTVPAEGKLMNYMFMCQPSANLQGKFMADYGMDDLGFKTFGVMYDSSNAFCSSMATPFINEVKAKGGTVYVESFLSTDTSYLTQLNKLKSKNPDGYYFPVFTQQGGVVAQQARSVGINGIILGSVVYYPNILKAGAASEKDVHWPYTIDFTQKGYDEYKSAFEKRSGFPINAQAQMGVDGFEFIVDAIKKCGSVDPTAIKNAMEGLTIQGWQGSITMDPKTHQPAPGTKLAVVNNIGGVMKLVKMKAA